MMIFCRILGVSLVLVLSVLKGSISFGSFRESVSYISPIEVSISAFELNRISFAPYNIVSVVGDEAGYKAWIAHNGREIYVSSVKKSGERFSLSVELGSGEIVDLVLEMKEKKGPSVDRKSVV